MITLFKTGFYKLIETKENNKILYLDTECFAWVEPRNIGEILVISHNPHRTDYYLAAGRYKIYQVNDEPHFIDIQHLELEYGKNAWQGYLLLTGLPDDQKKRSRIIPTTEVITGSPRLRKKHSSSANPAFSLSGMKVQP